MNQTQFANHHSDQFDQIVASLDLNAFEVQSIPLPPSMPPAPPPVTDVLPPSSFNKDLGRIYHEITFNEIKNAALTLGNRSTQFDLNWEFLAGNLNTGINSLHSQSMDTSAVFTLYNMLNHLRSEIAMSRTATYYALLHLLDQRQKEELEIKRKFEAAKQRSTNRSIKRELDAAYETNKRTKAFTPPTPPPTLSPLIIKKKSKPRRSYNKKEKTTIFSQPGCIL